MKRKNFSNNQIFHNKSKNYYKKSFLKEKKNNKCLKMIFNNN